MIQFVCVFVRIVVAVGLITTGLHSVVFVWAGVLTGHVVMFPFVGALVATMGFRIWPNADRRLLAIPWILDPIALFLFGRITIAAVLAPSREPIPLAIARRRR